MSDRDNDLYDVLIIGARVAGATLALLLGERGHRVLLIDRDHFPSDTLSTHYIHERNIPILARIGVLEDIEAAGFRHLTRKRTCVGDCCFEGPAGPDGDYALAPRRDVLDAVLIEHAKRRGHVEFHERTHADSLVYDGETVTGASIIGPDGRRQEVHARVVVGADGKYSKVAKWVGAASLHEVPPLRPVYYGYFSGVQPLPEPALELFFMPGSIGFLFPMQPGLDCLALELHPEDFQRFRSDPQDAFETRFRALPGMEPRLRGMRLEGKLKGCAGVPNVLRQAFGAGWALTGDAGCVKDPSTGLGIADAIQQSILLAGALDATLGGADWEPTMSAFQRQRDEALLPAFNFTIGYARQADATVEQLGWMRALLSNVAAVRDLAMNLPPKMLDVLPDPHGATIAAMAQRFNTSSNPDAGAAATSAH